MDTRLGGWKAGCMFVLSLAGYVVQSQVTQHVQSDLRYRQPYFIFYLSHSSFFIIFPLHLAGLCWLTKIPPRAYLTGLRDAIHDKIVSEDSPPSTSTSFPTKRFFKVLALLTLGITCPSLLWYVAVSLASISDVTAILNTNAFWAYILSVWMASAPWRPKRLVAVVIAVFGVFVIVYGGTNREDSPASTSNEILGDGITLISSVAYAVYQVGYKRYIALPNSPTVEAEGPYEPLPANMEDNSAHTSEAERNDIQPTLSLSVADPPSSPRNRRRGLSITSSEPLHHSRSWSIPAYGSDSDEEVLDPSTSIYPAFGLHPNFITSCVGAATCLFLWPPIILFHWLGVEEFRWPENGATWMGIAAIGLCGCAYNAGFMILLSLWGPTLATVGNLLTIVLVLISDSLFGHGLETLTLPSLMGATAIVVAFGVLVVEERNAGSLNKREPSCDTSSVSV